MRKVVLFVLISLFTFSIIAQNPTPTPAPAGSGIKANLANGEVLTVSQPENKISLKTTDGEINVMLVATTIFKKVSPEKPDLKTAVDATLEDIGVGDKILVTGVVSADKKTIPAKAIYLMTKSDISKKLAAEREMWRTRGISGRVELVDFKTKTITLVSRSLTGETKIALTPKDEVNYKRYAPDSVKFADAKDSNLAEIKVGDQLRALGDKSTDGATFKAEQIITGAFKTVAGKVTAVDVAKNEITVEDAQTKKPVTILIGSNSRLKKFPPEMAQMMARMSGGGGSTTFTMGQGGGGNVTMRPPTGTAPTGTTPTGTTPPANKQPANGGGQPTGNGSIVMTQNGGGQPQVMRQGGGGRSLDDMFDNLQNLPIAELKIGDVIGVTTTAGTTPNRYLAIKLLSGVEPFLTAPQQVGRPGAQAPSLNIPGLDGFGN